ncbi:hypothetical protein [Citricoccus nitrophenolicus]|uniref:hypothetical protein n=1 Tax=Citricoccus nitrophenolicus TaxID=863575 RepID=UPI0031EE8DD4
MSTMTTAFELTSAIEDDDSPVITLTITQTKTYGGESEVRVTVSPDEWNHDVAAYRFLRATNDTIIGLPVDLNVVPVNRDIDEAEALDIIIEAISILEVAIPDIEARAEKSERQGAAPAL